jgi:hypothetical protein
MFTSWLAKVSLADHSPHKFGMVTRCMPQDGESCINTKACDQKIMHLNLSNTNGVCGILSEADARQQITALGNGTANDEDVQDPRLLVGWILLRWE